MTRTLQLRVKEETWQKLHRLAERENRQPGQQLDHIIANLEGSPAAPKRPRPSRAGNGA